MTLQLMDSKMLSKRCQAQAGDTAVAGKEAGSKGCRWIRTAVAEGRIGTVVAEGRIGTAVRRI